MGRNVFRQVGRWAGQISCSSVLLLWSARVHRHSLGKERQARSSAHIIRANTAMRRETAEQLVRGDDDPARAQAVRVLGSGVDDVNWDACPQQIELGLAIGQSMPVDKPDS